MKSHKRKNGIEGLGVWRKLSLEENNNNKESSVVTDINIIDSTSKSIDSIVKDTNKNATSNKLEIAEDVNNQGVNGVKNDLSECVADTKPFDLDDVLVEELGQFGRFQLTTCILTAFPILTAAFMSEYIFSAASVPHRCQIIECGEYSKSSVFEPPWIAHAVPQTGSGLASCERYAPLNLASNGSLDYCPASFFNNSSNAPCEDFVYASNNSVVYDFDLGCQEWRRTLAGWMGSAGGLVAMPLTGLVSDRLGRRVALFLNLFNVALFGLLRAFSVNYPMYLALQFVQFALGAGQYISASVLVTELVGPKHRVLINCIFSAIYATGACLLAAIAWLVPSWRKMTITLYAPCFLLLLLYWSVPESVRWFLSKHKYNEARQVLEKMAAANNTKMSEKSLQSLMAAPMKKKTKRPGVIKTIFRSQALFRRVCTTPIWWVSTTLVYYGLSINSTSLSEQAHLNYVLSSAVEIPSCVIALLVLDRIGRKVTLSSSFLLSAACNIAFVFVPSDSSWWRLALHLVGKCSISVVFIGLFVYAAELYPTEWRHSLMAFSSAIGQFGSMIAPFTPAMMMYWEGLPSTLFGVMALVSGLLVLTQPETLDSKLPDTLEEAEAL